MEIRVFQARSQYQFIVLTGKERIDYQTNWNFTGLDVWNPATKAWSPHPKQNGLDGHAREWPLRKEVAARLLAHLTGIDSFRYIDGDSEKALKVAA